jgi:hypothetical protein
MQLIVKRYSDNGAATLGALFIDGKFTCFTIEDEKRGTKVKGETRIPEGEYEIKYRTVGTHHESYKKKYGANHYGMLELQNVPNFQFILIHIGNTEKDTDGCLLVGDIAYSSHTVGSSTVAYERIYKVIAGALNKKEKVTIKFVEV